MASLLVLSLRLDGSIGRAGEAKPSSRSRDRRTRTKMGGQRKTLMRLGKAQRTRSVPTASLLIQVYNRPLSLRRVVREEGI
ncbi:hypothetical protein BHE74_00049261 [Ensete ventricosum]|uniref:Uncharacterized protein n=1 Tax=Ensete ventricosum TaxID=4639 RepID=A0A444DQN5_ENSVE|nr:hypothetical protein B296_00019637 [Ensete ventricosum]RWW00467.1 hypothetical protein GW17_00036572 [Ensete ventricosum]RWW44940.1 hypothetical protein BHE74_00049261 [Ensete ventricosum]